MDGIFGYAGDEINPHGRADWTRLTLRDFGDGHAEISACRYETWSEPDEAADAADAMAKTLRGEGDRERSRIVSAQRARSKVRHRCKVLKVDRMLTLSTKEWMDSAELGKLFYRFVRRVRSAQRFEYVAVVEKHDSEATSDAKRGSAHLHIAVRGRVALRLFWSVWEGICGKGMGRVHVTKPVARHNVHRIACYIAKYVGKAFEEGELNKKRYWASRGGDEAVVSRRLVAAGDIADAARQVAMWLNERGFRWSFADAITGRGDCLLWMHVSPERHSWRADAVVVM